MTLHCCSFLALSFLGRLLVKLSTTKLGQYTGLFAGAFESTQGSVEILIFLKANTRHTQSILVFTRRDPAPGRGKDRAYYRDSPDFAKVAGAPQRQGSARLARRLSPRQGALRYHAPPMLVLGLETSCDETGVALFDTRRGLVAHALHSQVQLYAAYGGVVPEIASRDHVRCLLPLVQKVLSDAETVRADAIAYTAGPGLVGALMVAGGLASGLGLAWQCPVIPVHHMEAHLLAPLGDLLGGPHGQGHEAQQVHGVAALTVTNGAGASGRAMSRALPRTAQESTNRARRGQDDPPAHVGGGQS